MMPKPDVIPVSDLRRDAADVLKRAGSTGEPVFITQRGRITAVVLGIDAFDRLDLTAAYARGDEDADAGRVVDWDAIDAQTGSPSRDEE